MTAQEQVTEEINRFQEAVEELIKRTNQTSGDMEGVNIRVRGLEEKYAQNTQSDINRNR